MGSKKSGRTQLNMRLTSERKKKWESQIPENTTLSSVVRRAVERELNDEYVHIGVLEEILENERDIENESEIELKIDRLQDSVDAFKHRLDNNGY